MEVKMKKYLLGLYPIILLLVLGIVLLGPFIISWLWAWTIPDLFPGAVKNGLIAKTISWMTGFKISIFIAFLMSLSGTRLSLKKIYNEHKKED